MPPSAKLRTGFDKLRANGKDTHQNGLMIWKNRLSHP